MPKFKTVAIGDSIMWGQGIPHDFTFSSLASRQIARKLGLEAEDPVVLARSGAVLRAGESTQDAKKARTAFADEYPEIFPNSFGGPALTRQDFIEGDESYARGLFGEVPASFPTIAGQIEIARKSLDCSAVDLLLLNGGANDVDFVDALNPRGSMSAQDVASRIYRVMQFRFVPVLRSARAVFPNALIVVPGYQRLLSSRTSVDKLAAMARHFSGYDFHLDVLEALGSIPGSVLLSSLAGMANDSIEDAARQMIARADFAHSLALYWQSRIVREVSLEEGLRGPGILFVPARFSRGQALFADRPSTIWDRYDPPSDPMRTERVQQNPRTDSLDLLKALLRIPSSTPGLMLPGPAVDVLEEYKAKTKGPGPLHAEINQVLAAVETGRPVALERITLLARREIQRQAKTRVASLLHPNMFGARQYAERISADVRNYRDPEVAAGFLASLAAHRGGRITRDALLRSYGLDPSLPDAEISRMLEIDSLALYIETLGHTGPLTAYLRLPNARNTSLLLDTPRPESGPHTAMLGAGADFRAGAKDLFAFDLMGHVQLHELEAARIEVLSGSWQIGSIEIFVNGSGIASLSGGAAWPGRAVQLNYPGPVARRPIRANTILANP